MTLGWTGIDRDLRACRPKLVCAVRQRLPCGSLVVEETYQIARDFLTRPARSQKLLENSPDAFFIFGVHAGGEFAVTIFYFAV